MTAPSNPATGYIAGRYRIDDYGAGGFRFADMSHRGSILALPSGIRAITLENITDIDAALIDLALAEPTGLDILIIGSGAQLTPISSTHKNKLKAAGVGCETMATGAAVRTYNLLTDEGRRAGALLIAVA